MATYNPPTPMTDQELKAIIFNKTWNSVNYLAGGAVNDRVQAHRYYMGEQFGNEIAGQSKVVSHDVAEAIDSIMPPLMRIFATDEKAVIFEPTGPEDEEMAAQATDYVNHVWYKQNNGFRIQYDWFKSSLMYRYGVIKIWWDDGVDTEEETYDGLTQEEYDILVDDEDVVIKEVNSYEDETSIGKMEELLDQLPPGVPEDQIPEIPAVMLYDVIISRSNITGQIRIANVPSEEFLFDEYATDIDDGKFLAHRKLRTLSSLRDEGYDEELLKTIAFNDDEEELYYQEKTERHKQEAIGPFDSENDIFGDDAMKRTYLTEVYLHVDYDGDGIAEYRKVTVAGEQGIIILENILIDDHPFALITPIPVPFKMVGISLYDQTRDIQEIKSTLWRQALNNIYKTNNNRPVINEKNVNMDDIMNPRVAAPIRTKGNPQQDVFYPNIPQVSTNALQLIEYADGVREQRTGVTRYNQGLEADTLNKTAAGIAMIQEKGSERVELIARVFAETGYSSAFKKILHLVTKYQQKAEIIKLRNTWVAMDPREWKNQYNVTINVGLGNDSKQNDLSQMREFVAFTERVIQLQGGIDGPFVTPENIYNIGMKYQELLGTKGFERFFSKPDPQAMAQKAQAAKQAAENAPPTAEAKAYLQAATLKSKQEAEEAAGKLAFEKEKFKAEMELKAAQLTAEMKLKDKELQLKFSEAAFNALEKGKK